MRHDDVQCIRSAPLEEADERLATCGTVRGSAAHEVTGKRRSAKEARAQAERDERHRARLHEHSAIHRDLLLSSRAYARDLLFVLSDAGIQEHRSPSRRPAPIPPIA